MNNQDRLIIEKEQLNDLVNSCQEEIRTLKEENQKLKEQIRKYKDLGFEHLCKENQRLNSVLNKIKAIMDDYYSYDYEDENLERLNVIDKINSIVFNELKESDK